MTDVIHIRGETEAINAYDVMGLLPMKESATHEELAVASAATYGYLGTEELLEDCQMPVREVDPGYQAYLDSFAEVEAVGDLVSARIGLPVTVNGNDIRSAREAYDLGVSVGVLPPLEGDQSLQPMREVGPVDAETGARLTGDQCADCQGTGLFAGVLCEGCQGSGLVAPVAPVEESASDDAQEQLRQREEQRRRQQRTEQQQMEEDNASVASYMDDLDDDDDDDLASASSLNSGKKQRKPKSTARQQNADQTAGDPDNSYDGVMEPDDPMQESGRTWRPINEKVALQAMADAGVVVTEGTKLPPRSPDADDWETAGGEAQETDLLKLAGLPTVG